MRRGAASALLHELSSGGFAGGARALDGDLTGRVDIGGHSLFLACAGEGSPTVVLEAGFGGDSADWERVQPEVARLTRVCSYDRAGTGRSDPPPGDDPRTVDDAVTDLRALLAAAGIAGPYVLVGHSFGGRVLRVYAGRYPDEVVGLVFVDSAHPEFMERVRRLRPPESPQEDPVSDETATPDPERMDLAANDAQTKAAPPPPPVPVVVLTQGGTWVPPPGTPYRETAAIWQDLQAALATRLGGRLVVAENAGHDIHRERPDSVIEAIRWVVVAGWHPELRVAPAP